MYVNLRPYVNEAALVTLQNSSLGREAAAATARTARTRACVPCAVCAPCAACAAVIGVLAVGVGVLAVGVPGRSPARVRARGAS
eukprot:6786362-Prymnesium_polylepis.1